MSNESILEQRLVAVERAVQEIQHQLTSEVSAPTWLDEVAGSITDPEAFREALDLGRALRIADCPADDAEDHP